MITPWFRGMVKRLTGDVIVPPKTRERRDLDTLVDELEYLRAVSKAAQDPAHRGRWAMKAAQTAIGSNLFAENPEYIARTLPGRDRKYFEAFREETNPEERGKILRSFRRRWPTRSWLSGPSSVPPPRARTVERSPSSATAAA